MSSQIIVYSIYHNDLARITEAYYDQDFSHFFFRQSRILDMSSDNALSDDIILFLRWLACTPIPLDQAHLPVRIGR